MILQDLSSYFLTKNNLPNYYLNETKNLELFKKRKIPIKKSKSSNENCFIINQEDKLFWAFYIFLFGFEEFHLINNFFITEKNFKIETIQKIRDNKSLFKINKISKNIVENELVNEKKINLISLNALSLLYNLNIIFIKKRTILIFNHNKDELINNCKNIIEEKNDIISLITLDPNIIQQLIEEYYIIENCLKPINSFSFYKFNDLVNIAKKLNLETCNKKKQKLYEEIANYFI
jgi:hypothetical protein